MKMRKMIDQIDFQPCCTGRYRLLRTICFRVTMLLSLLSLSVIDFAQNSPIPAGMSFPADYPVIHPQFRKWASPSLQNEVGMVSPSLLWPADKKAGGYDIRLSPDSTFRRAGTISRENIPFTIFNPHQSLQAVEWYWQYRVHQGEWSAVQSFKIKADAVQELPPPVGKLYDAIPESHPRVLIDKQSEKSFSQQATGNPDAKAILISVRRWLNTRPPDENEGVSKIRGSSEEKTYKIAQTTSEIVSNKVYKAVDLFCKAYVLTRGQQYADRAVQWALAVATWDPEGVSVLSDFGDARCMVSMALVFDTFYDQLNAGQRSTLLDAIQKRAQHFYKDWINVIDAKVLSNHVWQYILHYFFQTAIAVYGSTADAPKWIEYAYELWLARAPVLGGNDGGWCEGASYFRLNMETLLDMPMMIKEYTGFDFIQYNSWYRKNPFWMLYSFPPASNADGFGDDIEKVHSPGRDYLAYADALSKLTGNQVAAWYAAAISKTENLRVADADMLRWFRIRYLMGVKGPDPVLPDTLAAAMVFPYTGVADIHSAITDRKHDLMISFRSSPYGSYGHLLADQNTFNVLYGGERIFYMSGHKVAMQDPHRIGWYKATVGHNGILIDDEGQPFNVEAYGFIPRLITGKNLSYLVGDASRAYASKTEKKQTGLTTFRRHILFLHPDIILIYDDLAADHPAKWSWLIHSPNKMTVDAAQNRFYGHSGKANAQTSLLASQSLAWKVTDSFGVAAVNWLGRRDEEGNLIEYQNDQWHVTASTTEKCSAMRFLAVMQIQPNGTVEKMRIPNKLDGQNELVLGNWTIKAELDATKPPLLEVWNREKHVSFSSGAAKITIDQQQFSGKTPGSSKLVELIQGEYIFQETGDVYPEAIKDIPAGK